MGLGSAHGGELGDAPGLGAELGGADGKFGGAVGRECNGGEDGKDASGGSVARDVGAVGNGTALGLGHGENVGVPASATE